MPHWNYRSWNLSRTKLYPLALASFSLFLAACAAPANRPKVEPLIANWKPPTLYKTEAVMSLGCLLPPPELLQKSPSGVASLKILVDEAGEATRTVIQRSSGNEELDEALRSSLKRCRFQPAYITRISDQSKTKIPDVVVQHVMWPSKSSPSGPYRCIFPAYPRAALVNKHAGMVIVDFRIDANTDEVESKIRDGSTEHASLRQLTLKAVDTCLVHKEAKEGLPRNTWISFPVNWKLED